MRETISALLLAWYDQNARTLPWRGIHDPYRTWVSETMLQQTRVETVRGYYERFLARFPDVAALAAAMGSLAVRALRSDDASLQKTAEELRQMTDYMVFQIDEELRAREPLDRRRVEENVTRTDLDSALRVASDIPNEIVYIMCRCIELMKEVVDKGDDLTACSALAAVHLSMAAIRCMQAELLSYAKIMDDDVFGYTIVREAELNLADHQELVDGLVEELTRRLTREKK